MQQLQNGVLLLLYTLIARDLGDAKESVEHGSEEKFSLLLGRCTAKEASNGVLAFLSLSNYQSQVSFFFESITNLFGCLTTCFCYSFKDKFLAYASLFRLILWSQFHNEKEEQVGQFGWIYGDDRPEDICNNFFDQGLTVLARTAFDFREAIRDEPKGNRLALIVRRILNWIKLP